MGMPLEKLPDWPAAMSREWALAYTGIAEAKLKDWEARGLVRFRKDGPRGQAIVCREDLDTALRTTFESDAADDSQIRFD